MFAATNTVHLHGDSKKITNSTTLLGGRHDVIVLSQQREISNNDADAEKYQLPSHNYLSKVAVPDLYTKC